MRARFSQPAWFPQPKISVYPGNKDPWHHIMRRSVRVASQPVDWDRRSGGYMCGFYRGSVALRDGRQMLRAATAPRPDVGLHSSCPEQALSPRTCPGLVFRQPGPCARGYTCMPTTGAWRSSGAPVGQRTASSHSTPDIDNHVRRCVTASSAWVLSAPPVAVRARRRGFRPAVDGFAHARR